MNLVLDSSMALAWCFEDERGPIALATIERVVDGGAWVPSLWRYEVANGLLMAERRGRLEGTRRAALLAALGDFAIIEDREPEGDPWRATSQLADLHQLTVYDAAYLELAQRRRVPLATLDTALVQAARKTGVELVS